MINVTVPVPDDRIDEFYTRFADFLTDNASRRGATSEVRTELHTIGRGPDWLADPDAKERAARLWHDLTEPGCELLRALIAGVEGNTTRTYSPHDLVEATGAKSTQSLAGTFGGIGQVISTQQFPVYEYAPGRTWHFIWDWEPKKRLYSISPEMAAMLQSVGA